MGEKHRASGLEAATQAGLTGALVLALVAAVFVAGCSESSTARADEINDSKLTDTVTVVGTGRATASPDEAVLRVSVQTDGKNASEALDTNSATMRRIVEKLKGIRLYDNMIETANVAVFPVRQYDEKMRKEITTSYRAQNTVTVTLEDMKLVADVFVAASQAGGNDISGPEWRLKEDSEATKKALAKAMANARAKAESLAAAAGVRVGEVVLMYETAAGSPLEDYDAVREKGALAAADAAPPVNPKSLDITSTVTVTFKLER